MKSAFPLIAATVLGAAISSRGEAKPLIIETPKPRVFRVELDDGSVVTGKLAADHLAVKTDYGLLKVPLGDLVGLTIVEPATGKAKVQAASFDVVGRIASEQLKIIAGYGELELKVGHIRQVRKVKELPLPHKPGGGLVVELRNRSRVKGSTKLGAISLETLGGRLSIPLNVISSVHFNDDRETAVVSLRNGDRLRGAVLRPTTIHLETEFVEKSLPVRQILRFHVGRGLGSGQSHVLLTPDDAVELPGKCKGFGMATMLYNEQKEVFQVWGLGTKRTDSTGAGSYEVYYGEIEDAAVPTLGNVRVVMTGSYARYGTNGQRTVSVVRDRSTGQYHMWGDTYYMQGWKCEIRHFTSQDGLKWIERQKTHAANALEDYQTPVAVQLSDGTVRLYYTHQSRDGQPDYLAWSDIPPKAGAALKRTISGVKPFDLVGAAAFSDDHHGLLSGYGKYVETRDGGKTWSKPLKLKLDVDRPGFVPTAMYYHQRSDLLLFLGRDKDRNLVLLTRRHMSDNDH